VPSLLIVDPDPKFASSLAELFANRGFTTATAQSGEDARPLIGTNKFDLLLTEIQLPGISGFELVREARRDDPHVAFAVLTSSESFWAALEAIRLGAREYLVKHLDRVDFLVETVETLVRRLRAEREGRDLLAWIGTVHGELLRSVVHLEKENVKLEERLGQRPPISFDPYRVLVVDDEPLVLGILREVFVEAGFEVEMAASAEDATARLDAAPPFHIVLADKNLPGASGLDLLRFIKERHPTLDVLMMTGYGSLESAIEAMNIGAAGYLIKPFENLHDVVERVREIRKKQEQKARASDFLERFKARNASFLEKYEELRRRLAELSALGGT
jgi:DNA-binding NtrC family response regulator